MSRYTGPKNKRARRIGEDLELKSNPLKVAKRLNIRPGQHGKTMRRKHSDYAVQLQEKQKVRFIYDVTEKQLKRLYDKATRQPTNTGTEFLRLLERRLDNVVYRMGVIPTRAAARQLVSHGHVEVNGKKLDIPSYRVKLDDVVSLNKKAIKIPYIAEMIENENKNIVQWLEAKGAVAKVSRFPERNEIDGGIEEQLIIEWYSR